MFISRVRGDIRFFYFAVGVFLENFVSSLRNDFFFFFFFTVLISGRSLSRINPIRNHP